MKYVPSVLRQRWLTLAAIMTTSLATGSWTMGFDVIKNVNDNKPLDEKIVLFDKSKPATHLTFADSADCKITVLPDGAIESRIIGNTEIKPVIQWKAGNGLPETFNASDYSYVVLTCRLEGTTRQTNPGGKITDTRPDNLWFSATLLNTKGERAGLANLSDLTEDRKTPSETVTLKIPMLFFNKGKNDSTQINGVGFYWTATRANMNRDFRLVIDRISLAN